MDTHEMKTDKSNSRTTPIALGFTPGYLTPAATCILSILKQATTRDYFHFICLLTEDLPSEMQDTLVKLGGDKSRFSFLNCKLQGTYVDEVHTVAASYRLLLPNLLPEYDKVLYVDCDIISRNNLADLYHTIDLRDSYLAGVCTAILDFQERYIRSIGCQPGKYINSGLLLMNLAKLRKDHMVEKFLEAAKVKGLQFPDQDALNQVCKGKIINLPPYLNSIRLFLLPQYKSFFLLHYTECDWEEVQYAGNVHYAGNKPWNRFTVIFDLWWDYFELLPENIKNLNQVNTKMKLLSGVYRRFIGKKLINMFVA